MRRKDIEIGELRWVEALHWRCRRKRRKEVERGAVRWDRGLAG